MAQPLYCASEDGNLAVMLVTEIETGETNAWCPGCWVTLCRTMVEAVDAADRERTDAEAEHRLAEMASGAASRDGSTVVRRGTSRSRRAYEARRRAQAADRDDDADDDEDEAPEPSEAVTDGAAG